MAITLSGSAQGLSLSRFGHICPNLGNPNLYVGGLDVGGYFDPIAYRLGLCLIDTGYTGTREAFGLGAELSGASGFTAFPQRKPIPVAYSAKQDRSAYGSLLSDFLRVVEGDFNNPSNIDYKGKRENSVRHVSSTGYCDLATESLFYTLAEGEDPGFYYAEYPTFESDIPRNRLGPIADDKSPFTTIPYGSVDLITRADLLLYGLKSRLDDDDDPIPQLSLFDETGVPRNDVNWGTSGGAFTGNFYHWGITDLSYELDKRRVKSVSYRLYTLWQSYVSGYPHFPASAMACYLVELSFKYPRYPRSAWDPLNTDRYPLPFITAVVERKLTYCHQHRNDGGNGLVYAGWNATFGSFTDVFELSDPILLAPPTPQEGTRIQPLQNLFFSKKRNLQQRFADDVFYYMQDLRPSSFHAVSDAVSSYADLIKANHIETIAEFEQLLHLFPSFDGLVDFLAAIKRGQVIKAGEGLLDFLSGYNLLKRFGIDPAISNVTEILDKADQVSSHIRNLYGPRIIRGKFNYTFPEGTFDMKHVTLTTRAKIRIHFDESSILAATLKGRSVGLFPALSSLWDVVDFSFVVDWFTNLGNRIRSLDEQATILAFRVTECTYSYKVSALIDEDYLQAYNLTSMGNPPDDHPTMTVYVREFSREKPVIRNSKFDWLSPRKPDIGLIGSLLWQVLS